MFVNMSRYHSLKHLRHRPKLPNPWTPLPNELEKLLDQKLFKYSKPETSSEAHARIVEEKKEKNVERIKRSHVKSTKKRSVREFFVPEAPKKKNHLTSRST
jgi:hypothetical protein